jgi:hypothetical protein
MNLFLAPGEGGEREESQLSNADAATNGGDSALPDAIRLI